MSQTFLKFIEDLELLVMSSPKIPLTNMVLVNEQEIFRIIDSIRINMPQEIVEAQKFLQEKESILNDAQKKADEIILNADLKDRQKLDENDLIIKAKEESERIKNEARIEANKLMKEAREYSENVLQKLEHEIDKLLANIRKGKEILRSKD
uniref:ATPase n=1 Tax=Thermodesulfobium narugense TaxID=184064 RepID=A0A7C5PDT0_9BACT